MFFFIKYVVIDAGRNHLHIADFYFMVDIVQIDVWKLWTTVKKKFESFSHKEEKQQ